MSQANPLWGAPRIHGELLKLGIDVSQASVAKYVVRHRRPPSQSWRTFLANHVDQIMAADFFVVPTATGRLLFVLVMLAHHRRRVVHVAVTAHPTAAWTAQQLREAFPWNDAPRYLIRDRDLTFAAIGATAEAMAITEVLTAPRSPRQNAHVERFIGSVRRECLDHVIILTAAGLQRIVKRYVEYYQRSRTHLALDKDALDLLASATRRRTQLLRARGVIRRLRRVLGQYAARSSCGDRTRDDVCERGDLVEGTQARTHGAYCCRVVVSVARRLSCSILKSSSFM